MARDGIDQIEEVDLLGSASEIDKLVEEKCLSGEIDYIVSSHNFEHLPDPIRFLQACQKVLNPAGVLSMAIPDRRTCFDYFRPHTTLSVWLEAYFAGRESPTLRQIFEQHSLHSLYHVNEHTSVIFTRSHNPAGVVPIASLQEAFDYWNTSSMVPDTNYVDVHCSTFTPASFELLAWDLLFLGLIQLQLIEIAETEFHEFFVHVQLPTGDAAPDRDTFYEKRASLLHRVNSEAGANSMEAFRMRSELEQARNKIAEQQREIEAIQKWAHDFIDESRRDVNQLKAVIGAMQSSKSWRLTAPLRAIAAKLRQ